MSRDSRAHQTRRIHASGPPDRIVAGEKAARLATVSTFTAELLRPICRRREPTDRLSRAAMVRAVRAIGSVGPGRAIGAVAAGSGRLWIALRLEDVDRHLSQRKPGVGPGGDDAATGRDSRAAGAIWPRRPAQASGFDPRVESARSGGHDRESVRSKRSGQPGLSARRVQSATGPGPEAGFPMPMSSTMPGSWPLAGRDAGSTPKCGTWPAPAQLGKSGAVGQRAGPGCAGAAAAGREMPGARSGRDAVGRRVGRRWRGRRSSWGTIIRATCSRIFKRRCSVCAGAVSCWPSPARTTSKPCCRRSIAIPRCCCAASISPAIAANWDAQAEPICARSPKSSTSDWTRWCSIDDNPWSGRRCGRNCRWSTSWSCPPIRSAIWRRWAKWRCWIRPGSRPRIAPGPKWYRSDSLRQRRPSRPAASTIFCAPWR